MPVSLVVAVMAGPALADPPPEPPKHPAIIVPPADQEAATQGLGTRPHDPATGAPGLRGGWAIGNVIDPGDHADARPYPRGMVIEPPDTGDAMALPPGGLGLPGSRGLVARLIRGLDHGVGKLFELVIPSHL